MPDQETMLVAITRRIGGPEELVIERVPIPTPGPGEVLIRVESASVNFSDVKRRRGDPYPFETSVPFVPGGEVAGTIAARGDDASAMTVGQPVFGLVGGDGRGGYAQYALARAAQVQPRPPQLDADRASALIIAGGTAMLMIGEVAALRAGESVVVPAALDAVGRYALRIARQRGAALVVATVGSAARAEAARSLDADLVVDHSREDWPDAALAATGGWGVDVLLESNGGESLVRGLRALAPFGRAVVYGAASGRSARLDDVRSSASSMRRRPISR